MSIEDLRANWNKRIREHNRKTIAEHIEPLTSQMDDTDVEPLLDLILDWVAEHDAGRGGDEPLAGARRESLRDRIPGLNAGLVTTDIESLLNVVETWVDASTAKRDASLTRRIRATVVRLDEYARKADSDGDTGRAVAYAESAAQVEDALDKTVSMDALHAQDTDTFGEKADNLAFRYADALAEIQRLRTALAYEADVAEAHGSLASFPKSRRAELAAQAERMREAARGSGGSVRAYAGRYGITTSSARRSAGMTDSDTLTAAQFAAEYPTRDRGVS